MVLSGFNPSIGSSGLACPAEAAAKADRPPITNQRSARYVRMDRIVTFADAQERVPTSLRENQRACFTTRIP